MKLKQHCEKNDDKGSARKRRTSAVVSSDVNEDEETTPPPKKKKTNNGRSVNLVSTKRLHRLPKICWRAMRGGLSTL
jgi:hypothetical protein